LSKAINITVFASGRGSNTRAILENIDQGKIPARIVCIISNNKSAGIFNIAASREIPSRYLDPAAFTNEEEYVSTLLSVLDEFQTDLIVLAGYLKKIPSNVIQRYRHRMINIHPALLPAFGGKGMYGKHVHAAVMNYGAKVTGVTVHFVDEEYDHGPIILQEPVRVRDDDTAESLAQRVLEREHTVYSEAIRLYCEGRLRIEGRRVIQQ
jgi:phosphoribosylglycinamide formyltransferase 1